MNSRIEEFRELCKKEGLRLTHQRLEILRELLASPSHPSVEEVYRRVRRKLPTISLDTVYRTIYTFERCGIVRRLYALDDRIRFDSNLDPHHHLICTRCKRVDDFYWPHFENLGKPAEVVGWGEIQTEHVEFRGLCKSCKKAAN